MQSLKNTIFFLLAIIAISLICLLSTGCTTVPATAGDESLDDSRILAAVNAERNRWTEELSQQLRDGLVQVEKRINTVEGGLQQIAVAAREYRQFVLGIIEQLSTVTGQVSGSVRVDDSADLDTGNMDRDKDSSSDNRSEVPNP